MGKLTSVAEKMGFESMDDKLRMEKGFCYKGYDLLVKRMSYSQEETLWESKNEDYVYFTGYIYIKSDKPLFDLDQNKLDDILKLHGGITYDEHKKIEEENYRVIGFDTAHYNDYMLVNTEYIDYVRRSHTNVLGELTIWNDALVSQELKRAVDNIENYQEENKGE